MIGKAAAFLIAGLTAQAAMALDSSDVLPAGINSPQVRIGYISGIGSKYTSGGALESLTDLNSITFDATKLQSIEPRVSQLINVLNKFGYQQFGNELTLGTLKINIDPNVNYYAPIEAHGITDKWTVAVGVPIVHYKNAISMTQVGSNLDAIKAHTAGVSPELDSAFDELSGSLSQAVQAELQSKGYKPIQNVDTTFLGDIQLVSLYQVFNNKKLALLSKTTLNLPTGPKDDPNDLTDLSDFGQTALTEGGVLTYMVTPKFRLSGLASVQWYLPTTIDKRVPTSEDDALPDASTDENVHQQVGANLSLGASTMYWFSQRFAAGVGFDFMTKAGDKYWGSKGTRYDLLEEGTNQVSERVRIGFSYDTISAYLAKKAFMPAMISYTYSDTIGGLNIARQTVNELSLSIFF